MLAPWVIEEMETADLSDQRLNDRLNQILSDFACRPTASIPAACGGYNEMVATYRFILLSAHLARIISELPLS